MSANRRVRRILRWCGVALLFAVLVPGVARAGSLPQPTQISASVTSSISAPCTPPACAVPALLVAQGTPFSVTVTLSAGGAAAAFTKDTVLTLSATGPGRLSPSTVTMPGGTSSFTFTGISYSTYANSVTVTASLAGKKGISGTPSNAFDVLQTLKTDNAQPHVAFQDGSGPNNCTTVDAANPVCGELLLPNGSNSGVLLSTGSCAGLGCNANGTVTQVITDLTSTPLYSPTSPATLVINCYRTICGQGGVNKYTALASLSADGPLTAVPPCPAKGMLGAGQSFCTDYVQSNRMNADDLLLYVLFDQDFRGSI